VNSGPNHFVLAAAFAALDRWVRDGKAPRHESRLRVRDGMAPTVVRDKHGNARGGVRTPQVDVPIAAFSGEQESTNVLCAIFGMTTPFDAATLRALYPTHGAFVRKYKKSLRRAVHAGVLLGPDADLMRQWAESAPIPP
jgi:hypothetical protein